MTAQNASADVCLRIRRREAKCKLVKGRVVEGEGTALIRSPLLGHEAGNGGYTPRGSLRLRPVLSYSETLMS